MPARTTCLALIFIGAMAPALGCNNSHQSEGPVLQPGPVWVQLEALEKEANITVHWQRSASGGLRILTQDGEKGITGWQNLIHLFGESVYFEDLLEILLARVEANRLGQGPLSGKTSSLTSQILPMIRGIHSFEKFDIMEKLLDDPDQKIRVLAASELLQMAWVPEYQSRVRAIQFPINSMSNTGGCWGGPSYPFWVKFKPDLVSLNSNRAPINGALPSFIPYL